MFWIYHWREICWGVDSCCINIWCHLQKQQSLLSVFAKLLCTLLTQARESHMRLEKMEGFIFFIFYFFYCEQFLAKQLLHLTTWVEWAQLLNQLVVVIYEVCGERKCWLCNLSWFASYETPVVHKEVIEVRGTDCPWSLSWLVSLLNHSLLVSPQVSREKHLVCNATLYNGLPDRM